MGVDFKFNLNPLDLVGSALSAGASIYNNKRSMEFQREMLNQSQDFNSQEALKQRLWQEKMWNLNNEYNTPMAQMERARAAGLNPSLLYGQPIAESQAASGGAEASIGTPSAPRLENPFDGLETLAAQTDLMRAQAEETRSRIPVNEKKVSHLDSLVQRNLKALEEADADIAYKSVLGEKAGLDCYETFVRVSQMEESFGLRLQELQSRIDAYDAAANKDNAQAEYIKEQKKYYYQDLLKQWQLIDAEIRKFNAAELDSYSSALVNMANEDLINAKKQLQDLENEVYAETGKAQAFVGMATDIVGSIGNIINIGSRVATRSAAIKQAGKSKRTYSKTTTQGGTTRQQTLTQYE